MYEDHTKDNSKRTCLIHGPGNSSDECKVLGDLGTKYSEIRLIKARENEMIRHAADQIVLQEKEKLGVKDETYDNIDDEVDKDELYNLDRIIIDENNDASERLKSNSKIYMI